METTSSSPTSPEEVNYLFRDLPRWTYRPEANFYSALCFMRRRLLAMDMVQIRVEDFLKGQEASPIGPLRDTLKELSVKTENPEYRAIYEDIRETLHSRLLRSRSDARDLTSEALEKVRHQVVELYHRSEIEKERDTQSARSSRSEIERKFLIESLIKQVEGLTRLYKQQDYLYEMYESGRSILNAFKQQRSYISEILDFYDIPSQLSFLDEAETKNDFGVRVLSDSSRDNLLAESREDVYNLSVSDSQKMAIALKQAYWFFHLTKKKMSPSFSTVVDILEKGELQNIGTKGHEWQAFAVSAFGMKEAIFETTRKLDTLGRTLEAKLHEHLFSLHNRLKESKSEINVILMPKPDGSFSSPDLQLQPERVAFEIQLEPEAGIFQRITYSLPVDFQLKMQELSVELSLDIHSQFKTKDFKIFVELDNSDEVKMVIDFLKPAESATEIHKFILDAIRKLSIDIELKARAAKIDLDLKLRTKRDN